MPMQQPDNIPRTSSGSLLFSRPAQRKRWPPEDEIIPDSEEERLKWKKAGTEGSTDEDSDVQVLSVSPIKKPHVAQSSVIVISSSSEEEGEVRHGLSSGSDDPFVTGPTRYAQTPPVPHRLQDPMTSRNSTRKKGRRPPVPRIESDSDDSVICISDTEGDSAQPQPSLSTVKQRILERALTPYAPILDPHDPDEASDDSAILTFDPHIRAKPVSRTPCPKPKSKPRTKVPASAPTTPRRPKPAPQEQLRLEAYARTLFAELNMAVFEGGMPSETELVWNKRLATTAGRAFWSRNRHGETSSKIELSPKVVDCDERVRNTLAHEMCHLAVWVLNLDPNEQGHGRQFKAWAARVTDVRHDIKISTKHTYEINFEYKWECCTCGKIYGRHSKSIDTRKMACGVCKPVGRGQLKALFETRTRATPKKAASKSKSRLASNSPRESPRAIDRAPRAPTKLATPATTPASAEDEVEELIQGLGHIGL